MYYITQNDWCPKTKKKHLETHGQWGFRLAEDSRIPLGLEDSLLGQVSGINSSSAVTSGMETS